MNIDTYFKFIFEFLKEIILSFRFLGSWRERNNSFNNDGDFSAFR